MFRYVQELFDKCHDIATSKGWWEGVPSPASPSQVAEKLCLIHSETTEALEELRNGNPTTHIYEGKNGKPEGFPIELADIVIRVADLAGHEGIDLAAAIEQKMRYNETRPHRHGGKVL